MGRTVLEVADIFHDHGPAWRKANAGHGITDFQPNRVRL
jgi:hypothetical protein